jgi:hypothetical protein
VTERGAPSVLLSRHIPHFILHLPATFAAGSKTTPAVTKSRVQALLDMLKVNTSIHTIHLYSRYSEHEIFQESVIPHLETNRFRPRLLTIQKTRPIAYRAKVLGRALLSARANPNRFWMILSGDAEVFLPSMTTAAANLSTPATTIAATISTAAPSMVCFD